jgi:(1->4)-alpha-D-glucan 1-alpha-D-glucosylmutase
MAGAAEDRGGETLDPGGLMTPDPTSPATYRLQFQRDFRLEHGRAIVPYLSRLGITHVYSSPVLRARAGSLHGYDVVDPTMINPELGDEGEFRLLVEALKAHGMGLILDIVPNHMAAVTENRYWQDVLTYGPNSPYARWFDIEWRLPDPKAWGRVLVPVLGAPLPRILSRDEIQLNWMDGRFKIRYFDHVFPVDPATVPIICRTGLPRLRERLDPDHSALTEIADILKELARLPRRPLRLRKRADLPLEQIESRLSQLARVIEASPILHDWAEETAGDFGRGEDGRRRLRRLLDMQSYRLVFWRRAARGLNYRRFFDINDLISIRQEDPQVFEETHAIFGRWIRDGLLHGFRVDHIDGLRDPRGYLERLRGLAEARRQQVSSVFPVFVEKILAHDEPLPSDWPVDGTTGYAFLNDVEAILLSPAGFTEIVDNYQRLLGRPLAFETVAAWGKRRILRHDLSAFVGRLADLLLRLARSEAQTAGLSYRALVRAFVEVVVALPVYRTYVRSADRVISPDDRQRLEAALAGARQSGRAAPDALDFLEQVLLLARFDELPENERQARLNFLERFQQLTGPATAKGIEDTALYVWVPLVSRNEVGGEPNVPLENAVANLHAANGRRAERFPRSMLAVTTHDTKRSADVRARLDVLSELPRLWNGYVDRWRRLNRLHRNRVNGRPAPDVSTEYLFYQTVVGVWPTSDPRRLDSPVPNSGFLVELRDRVEQYLLKAVREAKLRTSWTEQNQRFEDALVHFIRGALPEDDAIASEFLADVQTLVARIARPGFWNSLSRTLIEYTSPGTPDLYQGDELWNFSLVDPDNRRAVDYELRKQTLDDLITAFETSPESRQALLRELVDAPEDGRIKLHVIRASLAARREHPELFSRGSYEPLEVTGPRREHVFAFARLWNHSAAVAIVPRLTTGLVANPGDPPIGTSVWGETAVRLPPSVWNRTWVSPLTWERAESAEMVDAIPLARALDVLPVSLLIAQAPSG